MHAAVQKYAGLVFLRFGFFWGSEAILYDAFPALVLVPGGEEGC